MNQSNAFRLILFVADRHPNSVRAITNVEAICQKHLGNRYSLEIVDILKDQQIATEKGVYLTPMLLVSQRQTEHYVVGDMSDSRKILDALNLEPNDD